MLKYYAYKIDAFASNVKAAITQFYGSGAIIHYSSTNMIIFSCQDICDKVIKLELYRPHSSYNTRVIRSYTGDAYISGTSISNEKIVSSFSNYSSGNIIYNGLVLSDKFLLIGISMDGSSAQYSTHSLFAKVSNDKFLCCGMKANSANTACHAYFTDNNTDVTITFVGINNGTFALNGKTLAIPSYFAVNGTLEVNADGTFAYIDGLYVTSMHYESTIVLGNCIVYGCNLYGNTGKYTGSSLIVDRTDI